MFDIIRTSYLNYRAERRGFELPLLEDILRFSGERYYDVEMDRIVAVGKHNDQLVVIPYERSENVMTPVTVHAITRQQIRFRMKTGRFIVNV